MDIVDVLNSTGTFVTGTAHDTYQIKTTNDAAVTILSSVPGSSATGIVSHAKPSKTRGMSTIVLEEGLEIDVPVNHWIERKDY
jgi:hypothetical protein